MKWTLLFKVIQHLAENEVCMNNKTIYCDVIYGFETQRLKIFKKKYVLYNF